MQNILQTAKKLLKNRAFPVTLIAQAFIILALFINLMHCRSNMQVYTPPVEGWQSRIFSYDNGWHMTGQFYRESGYPHGEYTEIMYGPFISLPKGDYTVRIDYDCDSDQEFHVYAMDQEEKIEAQDPEILSKMHHHGKYHYIINEDVSDLEIRVSFNGLGDIHIHNISLASGYWNEIRIFVSYCILFLLTDILMGIYYLTDRVKIKNAILAFTSALALSVNPAYFEETAVSAQITGLFVNRHLLIPFLAILFYYLYQAWNAPIQPIRETTRGRVCCIIPAILFSLAALFGYSYQETDSWDLVFGHHLQTVKSYIAFCGLTIILYFFIARVFAYLKHREQDPGKTVVFHGILKKYFDLLRIHPFAVTFITLLIISLPYMIVSYPGIFTGDTADIILQAFNVPGGSDESVRLLSTQVMLNQHHPVPYTLLVHYCILLGVNLFHSANIGLAIVSVIQAFAIFAVISYLMKTIVLENASDIHLLLTLFFFILFPRFQSCLFVLTKDFLYAPAFFLSIILLWKILTKNQLTRFTPYAYILSLLCMLVLRNETIYLCFIQLFILFFAFASHRKVWICAIASLLGVHFLLTKVIYPMNYISPTTYNEALSIPIQQTARYMRDYPQDITQEEYDEINSIWGAGKLAEQYNPTNSDYTKNTYKVWQPLTSPIPYFKAWASMFIKHPTVYIQATLNNYYDYYYPGKTLAMDCSYDHASGGFEYVNARCEENGIEGIHLYWPDEFIDARYTLESIRETLLSLPFFSILLSIGFYTWVLLTLLFYYIYRRDSVSIQLLLPLLLVLLVCCAGPLNGYTRYYYPIMIGIPIFLALTSVNPQASVPVT